MKDILKMIKKMVKLKLFFLQVIFTKEILRVINLMVKDIIFGKKVEVNILVIILMDYFMGKEYINGVKKNIIKVIMLMELKKVMVKYFILMEEELKLLLLMENLMELESLMMEKVILEK